MVEYDYATAVDRNSGFMSEEEQEKLRSATVAIAGVGGDGALVAVQLARMGVESFRFADPDPFEVENLNRQATCTINTVGKNKAAVVADYVCGINPNAQIQTFEDGVQEHNVDRFVEGADHIIDETEFTKHDIGIRIHRVARRCGIAVTTGLNIGFAGMVTTYKSDGKPLEEQLGFRVDQDIDEIAQKAVPISRWLPYIPTYGDMNVLKKVASGEKSAPSVAPGVATAAGLVANEVFLSLVGTGNNRPEPIYAPRVLVSDTMARTMKVMRYTRTTHYRTLAKMAANNLVRRNPVAAY